MKKLMTLAMIAVVALAAAYSMNSDAKTTLDANKEVVTSFYKLAFNDHKPAAAVEKYVGAEYTQHNPMVADGSLAFIDFVNGFVAKNPHLHVDIKRVIAEGDLVVTHVLITTSDNDRGVAAMDIFRVEEARSLSTGMWFSRPRQAANENGMF
jgi:predicted SnoaL-like aldol condensation-catalyzing enzyme